MKKLILALFIVGCGYATIDNTEQKIIISSIERCSDGNNKCDYYGKGNFTEILTFTEGNFKFCDTCDKFQIGDTLNIVK